MLWLLPSCIAAFGIPYLARPGKLSGRARQRGRGRKPLRPSLPTMHPAVKLTFAVFYACLF